MRSPLTPARLSTLAFAAVAFAACADHATLPTGIPNAAPLAAKGAQDVTPTAGDTSTRRIVPMAVGGNTSGEGSSDCSALVPGSIAFKIDGAFSQQVAGYQFTVSGADQTTLAFAPIPGVTRTSTIVAVIVKGGPAYDVYQYPTNGSITSDGNLTSPYNRGGNIPTISHYVVCTAPFSTPTGPTVKKTLLDALIFDNTGHMVHDQSFMNGTVPIPIGQTRWLDYRIEYTLPAGVSSATLSDIVSAACSSLGAGFECTSSGIDTYPGGTQTVTVSGSSGYITIMIDIKNVSVCGRRTFTNTAVLTPRGGSALNGVSSVAILGTGPNCPTS